MNMGSSMNSTMSSGGMGHMGHDHGGMDMGGSGACKISMLWNWYTIDSCFLASSWHVTTKATFAVSCIGVAVLVVCLEALRRIGLEMDRALSRQLQQRKQAYITNNPQTKWSSSLESDTTRTLVVRVTPLQQLARAVLHAVTFGVGYIVMLLAMYFNGYIIICIILGAGIGKFFCDWKSATFIIRLTDRITALATVDAQQPSQQRAQPSPKPCCTDEDDDEIHPNARSHTLCCE